jgi:hypothetical protein
LSFGGRGFGLGCHRAYKTRGKEMIVWIAGWPHSGSALCRNLIEQALDIPTFSRYNEPELYFMFGLKCSMFQDEWGINSYLRMRDNKEKAFLIKTHQFEMDGCPAIYLIRDGRNAISGLSNFWNKPVRTIITGEESAPFMDWSTHFKVWDPFKRPNTLVVRFEDMLSDPDKEAGRIAAALSTTVKKKFDNRMDEYRKQWPQLFKPRHSDYRLDFNNEDNELFWRLHGQTMIAAGYGDRKECENAG